jgi:hypothetical protein
MKLDLVFDLPIKAGRQRVVLLLSDFKEINIDSLPKYSLYQNSLPISSLVLSIFATSPTSLFYFKPYS